MLPYISRGLLAVGLSGQLQACTLTHAACMDADMPYLAQELTGVTGLGSASPGALLPSRQAAVTALRQAPRDLPPVRAPASAPTGSGSSASSLVGSSRLQSGRLRGPEGPGSSAASADVDSSGPSGRRQVDLFRGSLGSAGSNGGVSPWSSVDAGPGWAAAGVAGDGHDHQAMIKEENRRAFAADASILSARVRRPQSGNKKFLSKYNLDKLNLFAP